MRQSFRTNLALLNKYQKSSSGTPAYTRFINRFLGKVLTASLLNYNISPNTITAISGIITYSAYISFLVLESTLTLSIILVFILILGFALDSVDGQLSRIKNLQSKSGEWFDHTLDAIKIPLGHGAAILLIITNNEVATITLIYLLAILSISCGVFTSGILKGKLMKVKSSKSDQGNASVFKSLLMLPIDYGIFILLFVFAYDISTFMIVYFIWSLFYIPISILILYKSGRQLKMISY